MAENKDEYRIFSRLELLVNLRNQIYDRVIRAEVDIDYFPFKARLFEKKSPEYKNALTQGKQIKQSLKLDRMCLDIIDDHIEEEQKRNKQEKPKN